MPTPKGTKKKPTFEERLLTVEKLIDAMENSALSLEESMEYYEKGIHLIADLEKELADATQRLTVIRQNQDGQDVEVPLEVLHEKL